MSRGGRLKFVVGSRELFGLSRDLADVSFTLPQLLADDAGDATPQFPPLAERADGYRVLSAPVACIDAIARAHPGLIVGGRQTYRRHYIDMARGFDEYMQQFSGKTRSGIRRKARKVADRNGGTLDVREYRTSADIATFMDHAVRLSAKTYQARLLDAGLTGSAQERAEAVALAGADAVRGFLLFIGDRPVSYLYLPIIDDVVVYSALGYDPDFASLSLGTVLQIEAMRALFAENRYRYFDFTEGDGAHKRMFATDSREAATFFLLTKSPLNRMALGALTRFDALVAWGRAQAERRGASGAIRKLLRAG